MATLDADLVAAGVTLHEHPGWESATNGGRDRVDTVGVVVHWDAITYWPGDDLYTHQNQFGGILYHAVIDPAGTVRLYSQRYVYHAGLGSPMVLTDLQAGASLVDGTASNTNGNPWMVGIALNYHPNQNGIPTNQYTALVRACAGLIDHYELNTAQIIDHARWTPRKPDVRSTPGFNLTRLRSDVDTHRKGASMWINDLAGDPFEYIGDKRSRFAVEYWQRRLIVITPLLENVFDPALNGGTPWGTWNTDFQDAIAGFGSRRGIGPGEGSRIDAAYAAATAGTGPVPAHTHQGSVTVT